MTCVQLRFSIRIALQRMNFVKTNNNSTCIIFTSNFFGRKSLTLNSNGRSVVLVVFTLNYVCSAIISCKEGIIEFGYQSCHIQFVKIFVTNCLVVFAALCVPDSVCHFDILTLFRALPPPSKVICLSLFALSLLLFFSLSHDMLYYQTIHRLLAASLYYVL